MGRPRKASDEQVFAAAFTVMQKRGPAEITLAEIAKEAGLTAGALVQRYGSKRDLLLKLMEAWAGSSGGMLEGLRAANPSPLAAVRAWGDCFAQMGGGSSEGLAHHLAWLQQDLADPGFRKFVRADAKVATKVLTGWLEEAIRAGELSRDADAAALARGIQAIVAGSLISWGFLRQGSATTWIRRDVDLLLRPWER